MHGISPGVSGARRNKNGRFLDTPAPAPTQSTGDITAEELSRRTFPKNIPEEHSRGTFPGVAQVLPRSLKRNENKWATQQVASEEKEKIRTKHAIRYFQSIFTEHPTTPRRSHFSWRVPSSTPETHARPCGRPHAVWRARQEPPQTQIQSAWKREELHRRQWFYVCVYVFCYDEIFILFL